METKIIKILITLGVPSVALGVFISFFGANFQFSQITDGQYRTPRGLPCRNSMEDYRAKDDCRNIVADSCGARDPNRTDYEALLLLLYLEKNGVDVRVRFRIEAKALVGRFADTHGHQRHSQLTLEITALDQAL